MVNSRIDGYYGKLVQREYDCHSTAPAYPAGNNQAVLHTNCFTKWDIYALGTGTSLSPATARWCRFHPVGLLVYLFERVCVCRDVCRADLTMEACHTHTHTHTTFLQVYSWGYIFEQAMRHAPLKSPIPSLGPKNRSFNRTAWKQIMSQPVAHGDRMTHPGVG